MSATELVRRILWLPNRQPEKGPVSFFDGTIVYASHIGRSVPGHVARTHFPPVGSWENCVLFRASEGAPYFAYPNSEENDDLVMFPGVSAAAKIDWQTDDPGSLYGTFLPEPGLYCRIYRGGNEHFGDWPQRPSDAIPWTDGIDSSTCWIRWTIARDNRMIGAAYPTADAAPTVVPLFETTHGLYFLTDGTYFNPAQGTKVDVTEEGGSIVVRLKPQL